MLRQRSKPLANQRCRSGNRLSSGLFARQADVYQRSLTGVTQARRKPCGDLDCRGHDSKTLIKCCELTPFAWPPKIAFDVALVAHFCE